MRPLFTKTRFQHLIGIVVSLVFLILAFRGVDWGELLYSLSVVNLRLVLVAVLLLIGSLVMRAFRWRALLVPLAVVPLVDIFSYTMIGYLANNVLPFRLGKVMRAGLLGEKRDISKTGVFATVVVERLLDVLSLLALVAFLMLVLDLPPAVQGSISVVEGVATVAIVALVLLAWRGINSSRLVPCFVPAVIRSRLITLLDGFVRGLRVLKSSHQLFKAVGWSLSSWGLTTISVWLFLRAMNLGGLPWYAALLVIVLTNLGSAIPSSPGFVGGYHFLAVLALSFWAVSRSEALSFAILVHGVNYVVVTGLGAVALWRESIAFGQLRQHAALVQKEAI